VGEAERAHASEANPDERQEQKPRIKYNNLILGIKKIQSEERGRGVRRSIDSLS
jgi:hypothetical protein